MDSSKQPGINVGGIMLVSEKFNREPDIPDTVINDIKFNINFNKPNNDEDFNVTITVVLIGLCEGKEIYILECTFVGIFNYIKGEENINLDDFVKYNAPAIMFPYIREHISSITQKSGMQPVYLAPINLVAVLSENKKDKENE